MDISFFLIKFEYFFVNVENLSFIVLLSAVFLFEQVVTNLDNIIVEVDVSIYNHVKSTLQPTNYFLLCHFVIVKYFYLVIIQNINNFDSILCFLWLLNIL